MLPWRSLFYRYGWPLKPARALRSQTLRPRPLRGVELLEDRRVLSASGTLFEQAPEAPPATEVAHVVPGELLIHFREGATNQDIDGLYRTHGLTEIERLYNASDAAGTRRVSVPDPALDAVRQALERNPHVHYAEPNFVASPFFTPNDAYYGYQWNLGDAGYGGIGVEPAWDLSTGANAIVAVLDTGVAYEDHQDATGAYYLAPDLASTRFVPGYDFINNDAHANDDHSHGTHVAGTIAQSTNNARGTAGVAFDASVMPVKVLGGDGSGSYAAIASGIRWAADQGAHIINMSLGGSSGSQTLKDALAYAYAKGVTILAAAGNDGANSVSYPAAYDDYVIAVSATRYDGSLAPYSNYGSSIDLAAPGGDVAVDQNRDGYADGILQNTFNPSTRDTSDFGYYFFQGTSMATPHVAGVAALIVSQGITDPAQVREILQSTANDEGATGVDSYYGHGIVDAAAAMAAIASTNTAPEAGDDAVEVQEDSSVVIDVLANDRDPDGDPLSVRLLAPPSHGEVILNTDKTFTYFPAPNFHGADSFSYTVEDGSGGSDAAVVEIAVGAVNDAPEAGDDAVEVQEDLSVVIDVLANDLDPDGDPLSVRLLAPPSHGEVILNADQTFTYLPAPNFHGADSFSYTVEDGSGGSDAAVVEIAVGAVNDAPVAGDDAVEVQEDLSVVIDVLANDLDPDGDPLSVRLLAPPSHGEVILNADKTFTYFPAPNFHGLDSFSYTVEDGSGGSDAAVVEIAVGAVNDAPVAGDDAVEVQEDLSVVIDVLANDLDPDGDPLSVRLLAPPSHGEVILNPDQTFTYLPAPNFHGADSFSYTVEDGSGGSDAAVVEIAVGAVNDAPVAGDDAVGVQEDSSIVIEVLANDSDVDGDALSVASFTTPANGGLVANADGTLTYTPEAGFSGSDSFSYTTSDASGATDTATVQVTVEANPQADVVRVADLDGSVTTDRSRWRAGVEVFIADSSGNRIAGVTVSGQWSNGKSFSGVTDGNGQVTAASGWLQKKAASVSFAVTSVSHPDYDSSVNSDPDGDSDGTSILIYKDGTTAAAGFELLDEQNDGTQSQRVYPLDAIGRIETIAGEMNGRKSLTLDYGAIASQFGSNAQLTIRYGDDLDLREGDGWKLGPPQLRAGRVVHTLNQHGVQVHLDNGRPWTNPINAMDVNYNHVTEPLDALRILNFINRNGGGEVEGIETTGTQIQYYDTTGDCSVAPIDVLRIINALARRESVGDSLASGEAPAIATAYSTAVEVAHDEAMLALVEEGEIDWTVKSGSVRWKSASVVDSLSVNRSAPTVVESADEPTEERVGTRVDSGRTAHWQQVSAGQLK